MALLQTYKLPQYPELITSSHWNVTMPQSSAPLPVVARLIFTGDSLSNNIITCSEYGLSYQITKSNVIIRVVRRDSSYPQPFIVAEWER